MDEPVPHSANDRDIHHEGSDVDPRSLAKFGVGLFLLIGMALLSMEWMFKYLTARQQLGPPPSPLAEIGLLPPEPHLQVTPALDLRALRTKEDAVLSSYGWVDRTSGIVRIPIERAIDLVAERGLVTGAGTGETKVERGASKP